MSHILVLHEALYYGIRDQYYMHFAVYACLLYLYLGYLSIASGIGFRRTFFVCVRISIVRAPWQNNFIRKIKRQGLTRQTFNCKLFLLIADEYGVDAHVAA